VNQVSTLVGVFVILSLLTWGGGMAAFPELQKQAVDVHHWLTSEQLDDLYGVGQIAPGPNMMMIVAIGERVAGLGGAVAVLLAFFGPTAVIAIAVGRFWIRLESWPWITSVQRGLAPVSIGLLLAGCLTFAKEAVTGSMTVLIAVIVFVAVLRSRINPAVLVLGAALIGLFAFARR
jgi:chromate transporter